MGQYLLVFMSFFAAMNPLSSTPVFLDLTQKMSHDDKKKVAKNAVFFACILGLLFFLFGKFILTLFGITIPAFQIGGGIIVFIIGLDMLRKNQSTTEAEAVLEESGSIGIAISPLAIPLIVGPGGIATIITISAGATLLESGIYFLLFLTILCMTYALFLASNKIVQYLGEAGITAISKIMGLILAIIGVQMIINGGNALLTHVIEIMG